MGRYIASGLATVIYIRENKNGEKIKDKEKILKESLSDVLSVLSKAVIKSMSKMNVTQWIESLIDGRSVPAMPIMTNPGIELAGMTVKDAVTDGEKHFKAIDALNKKYPQSSACTVIMDLTVEAEAFGSPVRYSSLFQDFQYPVYIL